MDGDTVAFAYRPHPEALALDLAIQAAGRLALPHTPARGGGGADPGRLEPGGAGEIRHWHPDPAAAPPAEPPRRPAPVSPPWAPAAEAGGAWAWSPGDGWRRLASRPLLAAAVAVDAALRHPAGRPIALVAGDLAPIEERAWLAWCLASGAALVLSPEPDLAPWALHWARPTVACLPAAALDETAALLRASERPRPLRRRLRRLHAVLAYGQDADGAAAAADPLWADLGTGIAAFPDLSAAVRQDALE
ncbi:MAG TPA: hypothetical protein VMT16_10530 [Thermoanaerobaculia bacterium]|nr:hypothetical protein [Thermoanaerobaculia bacterium]